MGTVANTAEGWVPRVVRITGGEVMDVAVIGSLDTALASAVERLRLRYTLGYAPANTSVGTYRKVEVRLADRFGMPRTDYSILARDGYYYSGPRKVPATIGQSRSSGNAVR
jgi:hypothetical protein